MEDCRTVVSRCRHQNLSIACVPWRELWPTDSCGGAFPRWALIDKSNAGGTNGVARFSNARALPVLPIYDSTVVTGQARRSPVRLSPLRRRHLTCQLYCSFGEQVQPTSPPNHPIREKSHHRRINIYWSLLESSSGIVLASLASQFLAATAQHQ